ncbi:ecdysteroid-regulated 16 kDa protein-like [Belonocnema kinseyi]|uniref:ecdysteroid-regulated 16 kDa protein-like n=1 Tax=Belonocnema kinseyi TaxID=2817044 RepID=UPI00143DA2E8|nr:ecdysteroid-regulated 16 kDa protein-like [Belonocnema kinseyi]
MLRETALVFAALAFVLVSSTKVNECGTGGRQLPDKNQVQITNCDAPPCKLKKKTRVAISQTFTPKRDIQRLRTSVHANIMGLPLPFIGVDGTDACNNIFNIDETKASCPLKKDVQYVYKNVFPILEIYPKISLVVHWSLKENNNVITCFEVPSRISS